MRFRKSIVFPHELRRMMLLAIVLVFSIAQAFAATVKTDKFDYSPGDTVNITGAGWQALETVNILVHPQPQAVSDISFQVQADGSGNISTSMTAPNAGQITMTMSLKATGQSSGLQAGIFFWDALAFLPPPNGGRGALCNTPSAADCAGAAALTPYDGERYSLPVGTPVSSIIVGAQDSVSVFGLPPSSWGACAGSVYAEPVRIFIKSPILGVAEVCGSRDSSKNIAFAFDASAPAPRGWNQNGCEAVIVAYPKDGPDAESFFNSNNDIVFDGIKDNIGQPSGGGVKYSAGYVFTDASGNPASCAAVTTDIHNNNHAPVTSVMTGTSVHDSAAVTGVSNAGTPTGQVTFTFYGDNACVTPLSSGPGNAGTVAIVNGVAHPSQSFTPSTAGGYSFRARYIPDQASPYTAATGPCEPLDVTTEPKGSIGDRVWNDLNGDGFQDAGEPGLVGVTVTLKDSSNNVIATQTTGANGIYTFTGLAAGTYSVCTSNVPSGFIETYDLDGLGTPNCATAGIVASENRTDVDFGYQRPPHLTITKSPAAGTFLIGAQLTFTIVVGNDGGSPATNVLLQDQLPGNGGLTWATATTTQGSCSLSSNKLDCSLGTIAAGGTVTIIVKSTSSTPDAACQLQPNPLALAKADGGLSASTSASLSCTPPSPLKGRMTGGGSIFTVAGDTPGPNVRITHGFEIRCDSSDKRQSLEINTHSPSGDQFHMDDLTAATCIDDPAIAPKPPNAGFDTFIGVGTGSFNHLAGYTINFIFKDAGEPGTADTASYLVWLDANNNGIVDGGEVPVIKTTLILLTFGNHQAHKN